MYRIAVCDDDEGMRSTLRAYCGEILKRYGIEYEMGEYSSAETFETEAGKYDLLLLDIEMDGKNGMSLAKELRKSGNDISIVFISGHDRYLKDGYSVRPIQYLFKPLNKDELENAIKIDLKLNHIPGSVALNTGQKTVVVPVKDIRYAESFDHKVHVHTNEQDIVISRSLGELEKQLYVYDICRCHNSYLVNLKYIAEFTRKEIVMDDGIRIPVGRKFCKDIQSEFVRYIAV